MSLILHIDTAIDTASVCLSKGSEVMELSSNENQKDHASWLHTSIASLFQKKGYGMKELNAVSVNIGPGSYTGLRVGLAAAKGICFALNIPLITVNSLKIIAFAVKEEAVDFICPVIDARRMEVFTAVYNKDLEEIISPHALVIDENSFNDFLVRDKVLFCGNGVKKLQPFISGGNAFFSNTMADATHLAGLAINCYQKKDFAGLAYAEPLYLKKFYSSGMGK